MRAQRSVHVSAVAVPIDQPLIGVILRVGGEDVVQYFPDEAMADAALGQATPDEALALAGAWSDLDWDAMADALEQIRHATPPSPPLDL